MAVTSWKIKNYDVLAPVWPIGTAFRMMAHIGPPAVEISNFQKIQDGGRPSSWKIENLVLMGIINSLIKTGTKTANINVKTAVYTQC